MQPTSKVGDEAWEVEWCSDVPKDENGDSISDRAVMHVRTFKTKAAALKCAREAFPKDFFGSVAITPVRFMPYDEDDAERYPTVGYWEACGETEHYEGDD